KISRILIQIRPKEEKRLLTMVLTSHAESRVDQFIMIASNINVLSRERHYTRSIVPLLTASPV
ncbi:hypothetical protein J6590_017112, partial [Homalodisca vitripennis]